MLITTRLWWRRGSSLAVLVVAVVATSTAVVGPLYAAAAAESTLRHTLVSAPSGQTGLHLQNQGDVTTDPTAPLLHLLPAGFFPAYHQVVASREVPTRVLTDESHPGAVANIVSRDGSCDHLVIVSGRCPRAPGEALVSSRATAGPFGLHLDGVAQLSGLPVAAQIVGIYRPANLDDPFWFGIDYFDAHPGSGPDGEGPDTIDTIFVDRSTFDSATPGTQGPVWIDYFLDPTKVSVQSEPQLRRAVAAAQRLLPANAVPGVTTSIPAVLAKADHARHGLDSGTALVILQLLVLAWLVLFQVVVASAEARGSEIALAKLRGLRPIDTATFALAEPALLLLAAVPLGLLAGWLATKALAGAVLVPGIGVHLGWGAIGAAGLALLGGIVATLAATRRTLRRPILEEWRRAEEHVSRGRSTAIVDLALALAAIAGLVALTRHSNASAQRPSSATLLGPALLVVAVALVGVRGLPLIGRIGATATRAGSKLGTFLAVRQVARRSTGHRFAVLLAVATGVAVFSVVANDVVRHNELNRARAEVGADRVVTVQPEGGTTVAAAVNRADPRGTWAMAAAEWAPIGGNVGASVLAVDIGRYHAVAQSFPDDANLLRQLPALHRQAAAPVLVTTTALRVSYTLDARLTAAPTLDITVADALGRLRSARGPAMAAGVHQAIVAVSCSSPCRLVDVAVNRNIEDTTQMRGSWTVHSIEERSVGDWRVLPAQLTTTGAWRPGPTQTDGHDAVTATASGTTDSFVANPGGWPSIEIADVPRPLPVLLTTTATQVPGESPTVTDLTGRLVPLVRAGTVAVVPRELRTGVMADLSAAVADLPAFQILGRYQVWIGSHAPRDALQRLRAAGLVLGRPDTVAAHVDGLRQEGPALALQLFLFASFACTALALAATALGLAAAGRRRSFEMAALLAVGVSRRALLRACILEQALLLGTGLILGITPGLLAAGVALPSVPEFNDTSPIALTYVPHVLLIGGFVAGVAVLVLGVATVGGAALLRAAVPSKLREATP